VSFGNDTGVTVGGLGVASVPGFDGLAEDLNEFVQAVLGTQDVINSNTDLLSDGEFPCDAQFHHAFIYLTRVVEFTPTNTVGNNL
jgi:hypothetical protein